VAKLSGKQKRFCDEYLIDLNATQAYVRAGYKSKRPHVHAAQLVANSSIQAYIAKRMEDAQKRNEISLDEVVKEIAKIARFDIRHLYDDEGFMLQPYELSEAAAKVVSGFKSRRETIGSGENKEVNFIDEYKTYDKTKALDMLMKYFGGYEKDNRQSKNETIVIVAKEPDF